MEPVLKFFATNWRKVWEERSLISLHRPIFVAFGLVVGLLTATMIGGVEYAWFSNSITSRDNEIRIKNATIENLQNQPNKLSEQSSPRWQPLSAQEALSLRDNWRGLEKLPLGVLCAIPACIDLAESVFDTARGMDWPAKYFTSYFMDSGIQPGIEIWSYPEMADKCNKIADTIEHATNGRLKISRHQWEAPLAPLPPDMANMINLVIGRIK
jgi:hypothetical protein